MKYLGYSPGGLLGDSTYKGVHLIFLGQNCFVEIDTFGSRENNLKNLLTLDWVETNEKVISEDTFNNSCEIW